MSIRGFLIPTFILTSLSWGFCIVATQVGFSEFGRPLVMIPYLIGGLSPTIVAFILAPDRKTLLKSLIRIQVPVGWYFYILVFTLVNPLITVLFSDLSVGEVFNGKFFLAIALAFPVMVIGGGLEEVGWRGILQSRLSVKSGLVQQIIIITCIWYVWHIPLFFIVGTTQYLNLTLGGFALTILPIAIYLGILFNRTRSLFMVVIMHALSNAVMAAFPWSTDSWPLFIQLVIAVVLLVIVRFLVDVGTPSLVKSDK